MCPNAGRKGVGFLIGIALLLAGCEGGPQAAPATTTSADLPCPYCRMEHYGWRTHRRGTPLERQADVMKCPYCRSAHENLWQGDPNPPATFAGRTATAVPCAGRLRNEGDFCTSRAGSLGCVKCLMRP